MKIKLLVVGKTSNSHLSSLINDYSKRINYYMKFEIIMINNVKLKKINPLELKKIEGNSLLKKIKTQIKKQCAVVTWLHSLEEAELLIWGVP